MSKLGLLKNNCRLVILEDIVDSEDEPDLVRSLEINTDLSPSKEKPDSCTECNSYDITGVEVMGSIEGIIFWECDDCEEIILRYPQKVTEKYLQLAKGLWTNPSDWGYVPRKNFN
tara:strand:+ start:417 stop:761 length:345 start_codon:yes stop_codon:yes gene_type:complete